MQLVLLSGGSGKRLWPLSNNSRSKQFLKLFAVPDNPNVKESMLQRVVRQLKDSGLGAELNISTSIAQKEEIIDQLGPKVNVITEPCRRDTFPAIALASAYLAYEKGCDMNEVVVVMPCDPFTEESYFTTIVQMTKVVKSGYADLVLMGINPTHPSTKFGYIVPQINDIKDCDNTYKVSYFAEKPNEEKAKELLNNNALWNGGVFAFKLKYLINIIQKYIPSSNYSNIYDNYENFPKISFDYEVVEKANSVAVVKFFGMWKDLGTWNSLSEELENDIMGNALLFDSDNTHIINELDIPIICIGVENLIISASKDGILISEKNQSEKIKAYAEALPKNK